MGLFSTPTLSEDYEHIYSRDPAIDTARDEYDPEEYARTGRDECLPLKPGAVPVVFKLQHMRGRLKTALQDMAQVPSSHITAMLDVVSLALVGIKNAKLDDGTDLRIQRTHDRDLRVYRVTDEIMATLYDVDNGALVAELSSRIVRETFGDPLS